MFNSSSVCSVNHQARALVAQKACKEKHRFVVGTCSLHETNELSVLQYYDDSNHFDVVNTYTHPDQVWAAETSPRDPSLVVTSRQDASSFKSVTLWRMPYQSMDDIMEDSGGLGQEHADLTEISTFNQSQKSPIVTSIRWHHADDKLLTVDNNILSCWQISESKVEKSNAMILGFDVHDEDNISLTSGDTNYSSSSSVKHTRPFGGVAAWDPHTTSNCAVAFDNNLQLIDSRDMEVTQKLSQAHSGGFIRDVDYNPNKPLSLLTCGDDRTVKFWDLRKLDQPILTLLGHSHWIWTARYNPHHDQLVLSGGSDNLVNLWRVASVSSAPWLGSEEEGNEDPADVKVRAIDQHEDSVYGLAWSAADAWIYASLSYDGRVIVNHVPSTEKYKILL